MDEIQQTFFFILFLAFIFLLMLLGLSGEIPPSNNINESFIKHGYVSILYLSHGLYIPIYVHQQYLPMLSGPFFLPNYSVLPNIPLQPVALTTTTTQNSSISQNEPVVKPVDFPVKEPEPPPPPPTPPPPVNKTPLSTPNSTDSSPKEEKEEDIAQAINQFIIMESVKVQCAICKNNVLRNVTFTNDEKYYCLDCAAMKFASINQLGDWEEVDDNEPYAQCDRLKHRKNLCSFIKYSNKDEQYIRVKLCTYCRNVKKWEYLSNKTKRRLNSPTNLHEHKRYCRNNKSESV